MNIKPIRNESDYEQALSRIESLMDAEAGTLESDELEVLSILVENYENKQYPVEIPSALDALKFRMDQLGWTQKDLAAYLNSRSRASEILSGKRSIPKSLIRKLHSDLNIPAELLIK